MHDIFTSEERELYSKYFHTFDPKRVNNFEILQQLAGLDYIIFQAAFIESYTTGGGTSLLGGKNGIAVNCTVEIPNTICNILKDIDQAIVRHDKNLQKHEAETETPVQKGIKIIWGIYQKKVFIRSPGYEDKHLALVLASIGINDLIESIKKDRLVNGFPSKKSSALIVAITVAMEKYFSEAEKPLVIKEAKTQAAKKVRGARTQAYNEKIYLIKKWWKDTATDYFPRQSNCRIIDNDIRRILPKLRPDWYDQTTGEPLAHIEKVLSAKDTTYKWILRAFREWLQKTVL